MKKIIIICLMAAAMSYSFAQDSALQGASVSKFEATQLSNNGNMFIVPIAAELQVKSATIGDYDMKATILLPERGKKESDERYVKRVEEFLKAKLDELKTQALFEFIDKTNSSLILSPQYSIKTESSRGNEMRVVVRIKGYPATYSNFRNLTAADSTIVKLNGMIVDKKQVEFLQGDTKITTEERTTEIKRN